MTTATRATPRARRVRADAELENHGSIFLLRPVSEHGRDWIRDNIGDEAQYFGRAVVIEPRYVESIVHGIREAGLAVA